MSYNVYIYFNISVWPDKTPGRLSRVLAWHGLAIWRPWLWISVEAVAVSPFLGIRRPSRCQSPRLRKQSMMPQQNWSCQSPCGWPYCKVTPCATIDKESWARRDKLERKNRTNTLAVTQKRVKKDPVAVAPAHIRECCWSWKSTLYRTEKICKICPGQRFAYRSYRYPQEEEDTGIAIEPQ